MYIHGKQVGVSSIGKPGASKGQRHDCGKSTMTFQHHSHCSRGAVCSSIFSFPLNVVVCRLWASWHWMMSLQPCTQTDPVLWNSVVLCWQRTSISASCWRQCLSNCWMWNFSVLCCCCWFSCLCKTVFYFWLVYDARIQRAGIVAFMLVVAFV